MLRELRVSEMRYRAVLEVLDGAVISAVARRYGVSRQTVHAWLRRYAREGAVLNLEDRSSRPHGCPHQMVPALEARVLVLRDAHPRWGPTRIVYELAREGVEPVPGRSSVYRALVRNGRIDPARRRRRRSDYKRWERGRPMELWQMDVVGGVHLSDGAEVKVITGIDDNSRFVVSAKVVVRATARPVCEALLEALGRHGVPEQVLTDNGKVFTGRFGPGGSCSEVLFDRVCAENGIRHLLTAPRSPTTTGKVERLHKTMRAEFFTDADLGFATVAELQAALDGWVHEYNTERPHQSLGMRPPAERFALAAPGPDPAVVDPIAAVAAPRQTTTRWPDLRHAGVQRWVDQRGSIRLAGFGCPSCWPVNRSRRSSPTTWCRSTTTTCWSPPMCSAINPTPRPRRRAKAGAPPGRRAPESWSPAWSMPADRCRSPEPCTGSGGLGGEHKWKFPSSPGRCNSPLKALSCAPTRSATTGPRNTAHTPHRTADPASPDRTPQTAQASRPRRYAVGPRAEP
jgi:transposase InsO family protein